MAIRGEIRVPGQSQPISRYTDAVRAGDLVFVSGVVPVDTEGNLVGLARFFPLAGACVSSAPSPDGREV